MVLESLISVKQAEKNPSKLLILSSIFTFIAVIISYFVFHGYASIVSIFLITIAATTLMYNVIRYEEKKDYFIRSERLLLHEHAKAFKVFLYFFLGVTLTLTAIYLFMPQQYNAIIFEAQSSTLTQINGMATASLSQSFDIFKLIFLNNLRVLIFCIMFSFFYGVGALFILNWNASVIAVAMGNFVKNYVIHNIPQISNISFTHYIIGLLSAFLRYFIHGIPEIMAYIIAGFAGGIISVAIIRYHYTTKKFHQILIDTSTLLTLSLIILFIAALLEVYVTPLFF